MTEMVAITLYWMMTDYIAVPILRHPPLQHPNPSQRLNPRKIELQLEPVKEEKLKSTRNLLTMQVGRIQQRMARRSPRKEMTASAEGSGNA